MSEATGRNLDAWYTKNPASVGVIFLQELQSQLTATEFPNQA